MMLRSKFSMMITLLALVVLLSGASSAAEKGAKPAEAKSPENKAAVSGPLVTFVEIGAARCIPCKAMQPIMKEVAKTYRGQVRVVFHDVWTPQGRIDAEKYNIRVIPTQVFLDKNGKEYFRHEGYFPKEGVVDAIKLQGVK